MNFSGNSSVNLLLIYIIFGIVEMIIGVSDSILFSFALTEYISMIFQIVMIRLSFKLARLIDMKRYSTKEQI